MLESFTKQEHFILSGIRNVYLYAQKYYKGLGLFIFLHLIIQARSNASCIGVTRMRHNRHIDRHVGQQDESWLKMRTNQSLLRAAPLLSLENHID